MRVLGSFLSAAIGLVGITLVQYVWARIFAPEQTKWCPVFLVAGGPIVFVVWLLVLLPLYFKIPRRSPFWRWSVCTICGVVAGTSIGLVFCSVFAVGEFIPHFGTFAGLCLYVGGVCGGFACLFGSLTAPYFSDERRSPPTDSKPHETVIPSADTFDP